MPCSARRQQDKRLSNSDDAMLRLPAACMLSARKRPNRGGGNGVAVPSLLVAVWRNKDFTTGVYYPLSLLHFLPYPNATTYI